MKKLTGILTACFTISLIFMVPAGAAEPVTGPLLSDAQFFNMLDLELPQLKEVKAAVTKKDYVAATKAFAGYLRKRKIKTWSFDPHKIDRNIKHSRKGGDFVLSGGVWVIGTEYVFPNGDIDWHFNLTKARNDMPFNAEWQWQLGRMGTWRFLGEAYWGTGEEKYAKGWVKQMRSWVRDCPRIDKLDWSAGACWRQIECGLRMSGSWPEAFHRFLLSPSFGDEDICIYVKSCVEHAIQLEKYSTRGNWLTMEMNGLYTVGGVFPEFRDAKKWRQTAIDILYKELDIQFAPDGAQVELAPGYHNIAAGQIASLFDKAHMFERVDELPKDFVAKLERTYEYDMYMMTPNGKMPSFNDSPPGIESRRIVGRGLKYFPNRQDFRWIATEGKEGSPPRYTSYAFPWAGYCIMRSGWEKDANYFVLDAGPLSAGHSHQDKLSVVLFSYGREILFDGGGGSYEQSKWREYAVDTFAHNTILIDGLPQERWGKTWKDTIAKKPIDVKWYSDEKFDFASGLYNEGYGKKDNKPATHTRQVLFLKPDVFIVADVIKSSDGREHSCQARWHLKTTNTHMYTESKAVVTTDNNKSNMAVIPLLTEGLKVRAVSGQSDPEILGYYVAKNRDNKKTTSVLHEREKSRTHFLLTLLLPLKPSEEFQLPGVKMYNSHSAKVELKDGLMLQIGIDMSGDKPGLRVNEIFKNGKIGRQWPEGDTEKYRQN